jgi:hypothetical protein
MVQIQDPPRRHRAPAANYVAAVAFGLGGTLAVAALVGLTNSVDFWLAFAIGAGCATFPAFSLGWTIFVAKHTVVVDAHGEDSVERRWLERACSGAFLDVFVATGVAAATLGLTGVDLQADIALLTLGVVMMLDVGLRYLLISRRAS